MPYVKRVDGSDATQAAHRGNSLGGLNEVVRNKAMRMDRPSVVVFWTTSDDIQPGDEVCGGDGCTPEDNAAAYDLIAGPILQESYEQSFVPGKRKALALAQSDMETYLAEPPSASLPLFLRQQAALLGTKLEHQISQAQFRLDADELELTAIKRDLLGGCSVRVERLRDSDRPGCTFESLEDCLVGESVCQERE